MGLNRPPKQTIFENADGRRFSGGHSLFRLHPLPPEFSLFPYFRGMRILLSLLCVALLASCEEKKVPEVTPYMKQYAGQYLIKGTDEDPKKASERFVLSPNGHAEWHRLVKDPAIGQFMLDEIKAGTWTAQEKEIRVAIKGLWNSETIIYQKRDSAWQESGMPQRHIDLLVAF